MARVALASTGLIAVPVADSDGLVHALSHKPTRALLASWEDASKAGIGFQQLRGLTGPDTVIVLLGPWPETGDHLSRRLPVPFKTRELLEAIANIPKEERPPDRHFSKPADTQSSVVLDELVRREIERLVTDMARDVIEKVAQNVVPEIAEAVIRQELERVLREAEEAAVDDREV